MAENASTLALGTLGIAMLLVALEPLWRHTWRLITVAHESGHTVVGLLTGHWVAGIDLSRGGGGATYVEPTYWPSKFAVATAGYPTPSVAGLVLARGVQVGWDPATVLATVLVILTVLFFAFMRNWLALVVTVVIGLIVAVFFYLAGPAAQLGAVVALAWVLLLGGFRASLFASALDHKDQRGGISDAARLHELTGIPANVWSFFFVFVALAALLTGARWLLTYA